MAGPSIRVALPGRSGTQQAEALHSELVLAADAGADVEVDASAVETVGQAVLQLLVAAGRQGRTDGRRFTVVDPSAAFKDQVDRCGLGPELNLAAGSVAA